MTDTIDVAIAPSKRSLFKERRVNIKEDPSILAKERCSKSSTCSIAFLLHWRDNVGFH